MRSCPITREQFSEAKPIEVEIAGTKHTLHPRTFASDSLGWNLNAKGVVEVDGVQCDVQIGLNVTIIGSKKL